MNPNPISDVISFLLQQGWTTVVYWLLAFASVAIAAYARRTLPAQRSLIHIGNWAIRHPEAPFGETAALTCCRR